MNFKLLKSLSILTLTSSLSIGLSACDKQESLDNEEKVTHVTLLYAVNRSSLSHDFQYDMDELEFALSKMQPKDGRFLVYCTSKDEAGKEFNALYEAAPNKNGNYIFSGNVVKLYDRDVPSTNPDRIGDVIQDALALYPDADHSLIFWGHGKSWTPSFSDHELKDADSSRSDDSNSDDGRKRAYGGEYAGRPGDSSNLDWTDLHELAQAIPSGRFSYIWFDCCYMAGIETIYQLRDKCKYYVGYPTEVWEFGLPYDLVVPYIFTSNPDLSGAANAFFDYYDQNNDPVTVAVVSMAEVEKVADAVKAINEINSTRPDKKSLLNYSRDYMNPYYDFHQLYTLTAAAAGASDLADRFEDAFNNMVKFAKCSSVNFNRYAWDVASARGINVEYFDDSKSDKVQAYYKSLDWYKRVF
ncbi:MAG: hypothetical protein HDT02_01220 [Bacteroidales bacterium]|nr:hypothetical protein [Bacteroidales bacterium]